MSTICYGFSQFLWRKNAEIKGVGGCWGFLFIPFVREGMGGWGAAVFAWDGTLLPIADYQCIPPMCHTTQNQTKIVQAAIAGG